MCSSSGTRGEVAHDPSVNTIPVNDILRFHNIGKINRDIAIGFIFCSVSPSRSGGALSLIDLSEMPDTVMFVILFVTP